jgi:hypothetical protein
MKPPSRFSFRRPTLAVQYADSVTGAGIFDTSSGLFLAAPRRTGKSTFIRIDLVPEFEQRDIIPIVVDLWTNRHRDPGELITEAIKETLTQVQSGVIKALRKVGVTKIGAANLTFDLDRIGKSDGTTIAAALQYLYDKTGRRIALIIDEAQHALTTEAGQNAMFALKAARDAMNQNADSEVRLICVFTGSNRDKLTNLVSSRTAPFYGAKITRFPLLDERYTAGLTDAINARLLPEFRFSPEDVFAAFKALGHRPEDLISVLEATAFGTGDPADTARNLQANIHAARIDAIARAEAIFNELEPLPQAILQQMVETGDRFQPFTAEAQASYAALLRNTPSKGEIQRALDDLRNREIIWRPDKGRYVADDSELIDWLKTRPATAITGPDES